jgi:hypothetical protein
LNRGVRAVRSIAPLALLCCALVAGCGDDDSGQTTTARIAPPQRVDYGQYGISFRTDPSWSVNGGLRPHVSAIASGAASVAIWRFPRTERLPRTRLELRQALRSVVASARRRDTTFRRIEGHTMRVDGRPAIEIRATDRLDGRQRATRTLHLYAYKAEIVVEGWTAPTDAARADRVLFDPLLRSLRIARPDP